MLLQQLLLENNSLQKKNPFSYKEDLLSFASVCPSLSSSEPLLIGIRYKGNNTTVISCIWSMVLTLKVSKGNA